MRLLTLLLFSVVAAFAQPSCVQINDAQLYDASNNPANGTIALTLGYTLPDGSYTFTQSQTNLTIVNGTLYGPKGAAGFCAPSNAIYSVRYSIRNTGSGSTGSTASPRFWTIPAAGGPFNVQYIESTTVVMPPAKISWSQLPNPPTSGTYCVQAVNGAISWSSSCGGTSALSLSSLTNAQLLAMTNAQLLAMGN